MKTIYFTITMNKGRVNITSQHLQVSDEDKTLQTSKTDMFYRMKLLSEKYNNRGYAVLFEID